MHVRVFEISAVAIAALGLIAIAFIYWTEPKSFAEVATKSQVAIGTYEIDRAEYERGVAAFLADRFVDARAAFERADPERRDPAVQFYTAYSFYRQGWGRFSNDDELFRQGVSAAERVLALDPNFRTSDANLAMKTPLELLSELEEGLKITPADFNPLKLARERK